MKDLIITNTATGERIALDKSLPPRNIEEVRLPPIPGSIHGKSLLVHLKDGSIGAGISLYVNEWDTKDPATAVRLIKKTLAATQESNKPLKKLSIILYCGTSNEKKSFTAAIHTYFSQHIDPTYTIDAYSDDEILDPAPLATATSPSKKEAGELTA